MRHATVLVNERSDAEAGEGGFEELVTQSPRGYVEPDPATFAALAGLFDDLAKTAASSPSFAQGSLDNPETINSPWLKSAFDAIQVRVQNVITNMQWASGKTSKSRNLCGLRRRNWRWRRGIRFMRS